MSPAITCPDHDVLLRLMLGQLSGPAGDQLAQHLEQCDHCASAVKALQAEDTLVEAARARVTAADGPEADAVRGLVERLRQLGPPAVAPLAQTGVRDRAIETRELAGPPSPLSLSEAVPEEQYDFLSPPQEMDELGRLGHYRVLKVLGSGGMGIVFQAEDVHLKRRVALKVMKPEAARKPAARERFLREARATAALEHEHIVTIYHVDEERGMPFLAMQWLKGMSLEVRLQQSDPLSVSQVLRLGGQIARGLQAAHAAGLIHRDIKPGNLWLETLPSEPGVTQDPRSHIRILDFGLAHADDEVQLTQTGEIVGTPSYMAPEQARGEEVDLRCDLFSLGVVLYRMCTGKLPFRGEKMTAVLISLAMDTPAPPQCVNPALPAPLADLITQLLTKDPAGRPVSAGEVADRLQGIERELASASQTEERPQAGPPLPQCVADEARTSPVETAELPPSDPSPTRPTRRRKRLVLALAVVLAVLLPVGSFFGGTVLRFATNKGELDVQVDDPNVEVVVRQNGVLVRDRTTQREFVLTAGDGEVEVYDKDSGLKLTTQRFTLTRGGKETVVVGLGRARGPAEKLGTPAEKLRPSAGDIERRAAEWALSIGGVVGIRAAQEVKEIRSAEQLPGGAWQVVSISFPGKDLVNANDQVTDPALEHLEGLRSLTSLNLGGTQVSDVGLAHLTGLSNLRGLYLNSTRVSDTGLVHLKGLTNLTHLALSGTQVSGAGLVYLKGLTNLTDLQLIETRVSDAGLVYLKGLTNLTQLALTRTQVSDAGLVHLKDLTRLESLGLGDMRISDAALKHLLSLSSLKILGLTNTRLSAKGHANFHHVRPEVQVSWSEPNRTAAEAVLALGGSVRVRPDGGDERLVRAAADLPAKYFRVTRVRVSGTGKPLGDLGPKLGALTDPTFDALQMLDLSGTAATDAELREHLAKLTKLTELALARTQVSDDGLASLTGLKKLRRLVLDGTAIRAAGLHRLKELPELVELRVGSPTLTDLGIRPLGELKRLHKLSLAGSGVSDEGLASLSGLSDLQELDLTGTKVTPEGLAALKKALPKCKVLSGPAPK